MSGSAAAAPAAPRRPWPARLATTVVFLINGLGIGAWAAALPRFKGQLGLGDGDLGLVLVSFAAGAVVAMPAAGIAGSRLRTGPVTGACALAFAALLAVPAFAPSLASLCLAAALVGLANGAVDVLMNAHASGIERRWGRPIMSSFHAAFSAGGAVGALAGGWIGAVRADAGLWGPAVAGVLLVLLAGRALGPGDRAAGGAPLAVPGRPLMALAALAFLCMMIEGAVADWSGAYLAGAGVTPGLVAAGYAAFSLCMLAGRLVGDRAVERLGARRTVRGGGALAAAGLALAVLAPGLASGIVGFGLVGIGLANVVPAVFSLAARAAASAPAGVAAAATAGYAGFLSGPAILGGVAALGTLRWSIALLALAALALALLAPRTAPAPR
ncbi:MFS transporter [Azospirillum sp. ST 5-10]|uniref:MFS transporter n=1 Tax=unclassified Azospirillum TaxID=2630922 RepID=UPI003F4A1140